MTQSTASRMLSETEDALGVQLFLRLPRGVSPTGCGDIMIRRAAAALAEMGAGYREVLELRSGLSGSVKVGTILGPSTSLLPAAVVGLKSRQPRLQVDVTVDASGPLVEQVLNGELDLAIGRISDAAFAARLNFEPLQHETYGVIARASHPLTRRQDLTLSDLAREIWVLPPPGSVLRDRLAALFLGARHEVPIQVVGTLSLPVIAGLLSQSNMLAALPLELVQPYVVGGILTVLPFDLSVRMDVYGVITRRDHPLAPGGALMLACLDEEAKRGWVRH